MAKSGKAFHGLRRQALAFMTALQGSERVAGIVIEYERVRFAEFRNAKKGESSKSGRILVSEGAVALPEGTIRVGVLARPDALTEALKKLMREGRPKPLSTAQVVIAIPLVRLVGSMVEIPGNISASEAESALSLEIEQTLPFSMEEAFVDWQEVYEEDDKSQREYLYAAARQEEINPYISAIEGAGLSVVAVEPVTLAVARGLINRSGITYIANIYPDALLGAAIDEKGDVRYFHHRSLPAIAVGVTEGGGGGRAQRIALELAAFIRFLREQFGETEQVLLIDGSLQEGDVETLQKLSESLNIPVQMEHETHTLSRAATRGVALRGMLPRADDNLVSLMETGTRDAYSEKQTVFFFQVSLRLLVAGGALAVMLLSIAWGFLFGLERNAEANLANIESSIRAEDRRDIDYARQINSEVGEVVALLNENSIPQGAMTSLRQVAPAGISIARIIIRILDEGLRVDLSLKANKVEDLLEIRDALGRCYALNPEEDLVVDEDTIIKGGRNIVAQFTFDFNPDFKTCES